MRYRRKTAELFCIAEGRLEKLRNQGVEVSSPLKYDITVGETHYVITLSHNFKYRLFRLFDKNQILGIFMIFYRLAVENDIVF